MLGAFWRSFITPFLFDVQVANYSLVSIVYCKKVGKESFLFRITFTQTELKMIPFLLLTSLASEQRVSPEKRIKGRPAVRLLVWFHLHNYLVVQFFKTKMVKIAIRVTFYFSIFNLLDIHYIKYTLCTIAFWFDRFNYFILE